MKFYIVTAIVAMVFSAVNCADSLTGERKNNRAALAWFVSALGWLVVWVAEVSKM